MTNVRRKATALLSILALLFSASVFTSSATSQNQHPAEITLNQEGLKYFNHGYYDLTPRGKKAEAQQNLDRAEKAFKLALAVNHDYVDAHRNLARLYYLQEKFEEASAAYDHVIRLNPKDIDSYVQMALVQIELGNNGRAINYLEKAKTRTRDEQVLMKLQKYIDKIK
jgi:tetratricopeptide (TPR) repeat protein